MFKLNELVIYIRAFGSYYDKVISYAILLVSAIMSVILKCRYARVQIRVLRVQRVRTNARNDKSNSAHEMHRGTLPTIERWSSNLCMIGRLNGREVPTVASGDRCIIKARARARARFISHRSCAKRTAIMTSLRKLQLD